MRTLAARSARAASAYNAARRGVAARNAEGTPRDRYLEGMLNLFKDKTKMIDPRPRAARARRRTMPVPDRHARARHADQAAVPRGHRDGRLRHGLLLGRRADVLAGRRRLHDRGRLRRRLHAEPDLRGGLLGPHRPHRGRARRVRPGEDLATRRCCGSSGRATTRPRACARATTSARSTARRSTGTRRSSASAPRPRARCTRSGCSAAGHGEITTEIAEAGAVLLRRGLPPAVPREEPERLLRPRRHRRELPDPAADVVGAPPSQVRHGGERARLQVGLGKLPRLPQPSSVSADPPYARDDG